MRRPRPGELLADAMVALAIFASVYTLLVVFGAALAEREGTERTHIQIEYVPEE